MVDGRTALWFAATYGNMETARVLIKNGANINPNTGADIFPPPIAMAATRKNLDILQYLANNGACLESIDDHGNTPLHHAARTGNTPGRYFFTFKKLFEKPTQYVIRIST